MNESSFGRWKAIRRMGRRLYVFVFGVLFFGGTLMVFSIISSWNHPRFLLVNVSTLIVALPAGYLFGRIGWDLTERRFRLSTTIDEAMLKLRQFSDVGNLRPALEESRSGDECQQYAETPGANDHRSRQVQARMLCELTDRIVMALVVAGFVDEADIWQAAEVVEKEIKR